MSPFPMRTVALLWLFGCNSGGEGDSVPAADTGQSAPDLAPFGSGSRLQAAYYDGGAADTRIFRHFTDTELGTDCAVARDETGLERCMPAAYGQFAFADAACTEPLLVWNSCDPTEVPPSLLSESLRERCIGAPSVRAYAIASAVMRDHVYEGADCTRTDFDEPRTFYGAVAQPSSDFAAFTSRTVSVGDGLGIEVLETAGGAHLLANVIASGPDQRCSLVTLGENDELFCLHGDFAYDFAGLYTDPTCEGDTLAYGIGADFCDPPAYALTYAPTGACGRQVATLAEIGPEVEFNEVYQRFGESCSPAPESTRRFYAIGAELDANPLPRLDVGPVGESRLQPHRFLTASGEPLTPAGSIWTDQNLGKDCVAYDTTADGTRCIPGLETADRRFGVFADANCTERLVAHNIDPCFAIDPPELLGTYTGGPCGPGPIDEVRTVGDEYAGAIYRKNDVTCDPASADDNLVYYLVGDPVLLDTFAPITRGP